MRRGELTDEQGERLAPLLPPQKPNVGRPAQDHRLILNGILWILRTGAPWRDLPERYGPWRTVASRFYRWVKAGVWQCVLEALQHQADAQGQIDWTNTASRVRSFAPINRRLEQKGGAKSRGIRQESRRFQYETASESRRQRQTDDPGAHSWSASRNHEVRGAHGARGGQASRERAAQVTAQAGTGRQSVQQSQDPPLSQAQRNWLHHSSSLR